MNEHMIDGAEDEEKKEGELPETDVEEEETPTDEEDQPKDNQESEETMM